MPLRVAIEVVLYLPSDADLGSEDSGSKKIAEKTNMKTSRTGKRDSDKQGLSTLKQNLLTNGPVQGSPAQKCCTSLLTSSWMLLSLIDRRVESIWLLQLYRRDSLKIDETMRKAKTKKNVIERSSQTRPCHCQHVCDDGGSTGEQKIQDTRQSHA